MICISMSQSIGEIKNSLYLMACTKLGFFSPELLRLGFGTIFAELLVTTFHVQRKKKPLSDFEAHLDQVLLD